jgi:hypothetical protein
MILFVQVHAVDQLLREAGGVTAVSHPHSPSCCPHAFLGMGLSRSRSVRAVRYLCEHTRLTVHQFFARAKSVLERNVCCYCLRSIAEAACCDLSVQSVLFCVLSLRTRIDITHVFNALALGISSDTLQVFARRSRSCRTAPHESG